MLSVETAAKSDAGAHRADNEDVVASVDPPEALQRERKGLLFLVADGMGGHLAGEVASRTAVEAASSEYYSPANQSRIEPALRNAVQTANLRVHDLSQRNPDYRGMGTTLSALVISGNQAYIAHVGDSRVYRWRGGTITQLTSDHSEAAELVRMRLISADRLHSHPGRSALTRTIGHQLIVRPDFMRQPVDAGDQFLMCTDGLWSEIAESEFQTVLGESGPDEACRRLIDLALERECEDNVSVQIVAVKSVDPQTQQNARGNWLSNIFQRGN